MGFLLDDDDDDGCEPDESPAVGHGTAEMTADDGPTLAEVVKLVQKLAKGGAMYVKIGDVEVSYVKPAKVSDNG
jgi:hypothetical protein